MTTYVSTYQTGRGLGPWRSLFRDILRHMSIDSILEAGAGSPAFLSACDIPKRVAVDLTPDNAATYTALGISFAVKNLEHDALTDLGTYDAVVCSDVFEHLVHPLHALHAIRDVLHAEGVLFSHVPNEFAFRKLVKIMFGRKTSVNFHKKALPEEWNDPHIRRFTDLGYTRMLATAFRYNIKLTQFRHSNFARLLSRTIGLVPYTLEKGPTYASTNSAATAQRITAILGENTALLRAYR